MLGTTKDLRFFVRYLGMIVNDNHRIVIIEYVFCYFKIVVFYKTAKLIVSEHLSMLAAICTILLYGTTFDGGNLTEEYAFLFISISNYILIKSLLLKQELLLDKVLPLGRCLLYVCCCA